MRLEYKRGKKFFVYDGKKILFGEIVDISKKVSTSFTNSVYEKRELVVTLSFEKNSLNLRADTVNLEQFKLLTELLEDINKFKNIQSVGTPLKVEKDSKIENYLWGIVILFGINGLSEILFKTSFLKHTEPFESISLLAGLMLGIWIIVTPMYFLVDKLNGRKFQREDNLIAGEPSSVKDFDFSNLLLVLLVLGLVYLLMQ